MTRVDAQAFRADHCGGRVMMLGPAPDVPLALTVRLVAGYARDHRGPLGTFTVMNAGDRRITGMSGPAAWVWIARGGVVVTEPGAMPAVNVRVDLAPGESLSADLHSVLRQCDSAAADVALAPGRYEVYVRWDLRPDDGDEIALYACPAAIDLR